MRSCSRSVTCRAGADVPEGPLAEPADELLAEALLAEALLAEALPAEALPAEAPEAAPSAARAGVSRVAPAGDAATPAAPREASSSLRFSGTASAIVPS